MKQSAFVIGMLLGASSAAHIQQLGAPETPTCTNANKATTEDETCSSAGNSAWNTITTSRTAKPENAQADPYPGHAEHIQLEGVTGKGFKGSLDFKVDPATNACTNANKATTDDETCSTAGNSAWNTITSSRTAKPADAMADPYPAHSEFVNFDSGSSRDTYPSYVPTNGGYPKVGPDQRAAKAPAAEVQTPPADTAAPEAVGWYKDAWKKSGSQKSIFGNNQYPQALQQFDSGSSRDVFPPYVPTNGAYPKVGPEQRALKAPIAGSWNPPADADTAPEAHTWNKDTWSKSGSQKSIFANNQYPQALYQFDSGSSRDTFPSYVPTNDAYPKVGPDQRAAKAPAVETQTPPADTAAPEAVGWYKDAWSKSGSQKSIFGNNQYPQALEQFDSGSSRDVFPPYVPTNGAYPKVGPEQRALKAPIAGSWNPPADADTAPEAHTWNKDTWSKSGSQKSIFANNQYPQALTQFDSGSSRDTFPPYVPTNGAYPKVGPDQRALKAPVAGSWNPPADADSAPESHTWMKDTWSKSGSQKSIFANNEYPQALIQLESEGVTGKGFKGSLDFAVTPAKNACVNTNKNSAEDEDCSDAGNSAWNTITTSRTAKPADAMAEPYPGHTEN